MNRKLTQDDGRAVDLVLETRANAAAAHGVYVRPDSLGMNARIGAVERLLGVLSSMPAAEPPADLVTRTLRRIEETGDEVMDRPRPAAHPAVAAHRPA